MLYMLFDVMRTFIPLRCTLLPSVASDGFWHCLALARFIIGVGLGGAYPLTAVVAGGSEKVSQVGPHASFCGKSRGNP